jgi:alpha-amylase
MKRFSPLVGLLILLACQQPESLLSVPDTRDEGGVIVHLFEWTWSDIAQECEQFLGPAGYGAVQVSPPGENHIIGGRPWFERYQPVSYRLESRSGSREEFADMVARCDQAGVDIYADVLLNHMADADLIHEGDLVFSGTGTAGSLFGPWEFPGLFGYDDFHHCDQTENGHIADWNDRIQLTECELVGLADLATETQPVRETLAAYLNDLVSFGVSGFRLDAAKHLSSDDIQAILDMVEDPGYIVQEIATGGRMANWVLPYISNGDVTAFSYTEAMGELIRQRSWADLAPTGWFWNSREFIPSSEALIFVDNHDRQRGHGGAAAISHRDGITYDLAQVYTLTWPYGRKRVMSSYAFDHDSEGPPMHEDESIRSVFSESGLNCGLGEWVCEHRRPAIAGAVAFSNAVSAGAPVTHWWTNESDQIAFGRGNEGFVVINGSGKQMVTSLQSGLPEGEYCNRLSNEECEIILVSNESRVQVNLASQRAIAIDLGAVR